MFLSFIVPVYNVEKYLPECLDSLLDQDIPAEDYEIICVNDGSTDNSLQILRDHEARCPNVRVIDKENGGVCRARNAGLDAAKGDYIWFVDSDDLVRGSVLGMLKEIAGDTDCDRLKIGVYAFTGQLSGGEKENLENGTLAANAHFYDSSVWNSLLKKAFIDSNNCRFHYPELTNGEDSIFVFELVTHEPVQVELDIPIYFYRNRPGSAETSVSAENRVRKLRSYLAAAKVMKQHWDASDEGTRDAANLLMSFIWYTVHTSILVSGREGRWAIKELKKSGLYPFVRPTACDHTRSYQTTRTDFIGRLFDRVYINMHRPWGRWAMWGLQKVIELKHSIRG